MKQDLRTLTVTAILGSGLQPRMAHGQDTASNAFAFVVAAAGKEAAQFQPCFPTETGKCRAAQA